ncbi:hypothetical protein N0V83_007863 [Neocucurbitaria cava]|uniref:Uncharacterized protein n=1 Tax=Neocucurbitaria cava TaxID=798079 RepID=A0A9W9CK00_9PLEO|nr:hypothetical protein N0V83_007863 [Neocucurbitaria cava]
MNTSDNGRSGKTQHSTAVKVRNKDKLAVWTDSYVFDSPTRTKATVVFAAIDGSIIGGDTETTKKVFKKQITSIACEIAVEFVDDILTVGMAPDAARAQLGSVAQLNNSKSLNELALWFAVSPVSNGASVDGAMPLYGDPLRKIPVRYTSTSEGSNQGWETEKIKHFISVSIGATALRASTSPEIKPVTMLSRTYTLKLDPSRPLLLLVLPTLMLLNASLLVLWHARLYGQTEIPYYQQAKLSEILTFSQSSDIRNAAELAWRNNKARSKNTSFNTSIWKRLRISLNKRKNTLDSQQVRYWPDEGAWALHAVKATSKERKKSRGQPLTGYELPGRQTELV